jgi:hypothetical protein
LKGFKRKSAERESWISQTSVFCCLQQMRTNSQKHRVRSQPLSTFGQPHWNAKDKKIQISHEDGGYSKKRQHISLEWYVLDRWDLCWMAWILLCSPVAGGSEWTDFGKRLETDAETRPDLSIYDLDLQTILHSHPAIGFSSRQSDNYEHN